MFELPSLISAIIATYAGSRITWRLFRFVASPPLRLAATHLVSFGALAAWIGLTKAYFVTFPVEETFVLIGPALLWLVIDLLRGKASRADVSRVRASGRGAA